MTDHCTRPTLAISGCQDTLEVENNLFLLERKRHSDKYDDLSLAKLPTVFLLV